MIERTTTSTEDSQDLSNREYLTLLHAIFEWRTKCLVSSETKNKNLDPNETISDIYSQSLVDAHVCYKPELLVKAREKNIEQKTKHLLKEAKKQYPNCFVAIDLDKDRIVLASVHHDEFWKMFKKLDKTNVRTYHTKYLKATQE